MKTTGWLLGLLLAPIATAPAAPFAYVTNQGDHSVSVVDLADGSVAATVPVGEAPAGVAVSRDGRRVVIADPKTRQVYLLDGSTHTILAQGDAGEGPLGIALSPDGDRVYVADWFEDQLLILNTTTLAQVGHVAVGDAPSGVAVSPDGKRVFVSDRDDNRVSVIDSERLEVVGRVATGQRPFGLAVDAAGRRLYVRGRRHLNRTGQPTGGWQIAVQPNAWQCAKPERSKRMFIPNYPEDSVLRRHYEAAAAQRRQRRLREPPADSVLRRHFHQLEQVRGMRSSPASAKLADTARSTARISASAPRPEPVATQQPTKNPAKGGGLFSRLRRFFSS